MVSLKLTYIIRILQVTLQKVQKENLCFIYTHRTINNVT